VAISDSQAALARWHHRASQALTLQAEHEREARNAAIRALRVSDPQRWTYSTLARAVGCSPELIAQIVRSRP
jgi:AraC-like DNA-binding protein